MAMYYIDMDVTLSVRMWRNAESPEEAERKALEDIKRDTIYYAQHGAFVGAEVTDCFIDEEE